MPAKHIMKQSKHKSSRYNADCPSLPRCNLHCPTGKPWIGVGWDTVCSCFLLPGLVAKLPPKLFHKSQWQKSNFWLLFSFLNPFIFFHYSYLSFSVRILILILILTLLHIYTFLILIHVSILLHFVHEAAPLTSKSLLVVNLYIWGVYRDTANNRGNHQPWIKN